MWCARFTFNATRHHCGGVCREELGDLWVAFFLSVTQQPHEMLELGIDQANPDVARGAILFRLMREQQNGHAQ
jgi:hypothetical protein